MITFIESSGGYARRTRENSQACDITIAIATDFNTAGERLTRSCSKEYLSTLFNPHRVEIDAKDIAADIQKIFDDVHHVSINFAGNGIYTLTEKGYTQDDVDKYMKQYMIRLITELSLVEKTISVNTGGQTGIDEAAAKAAAKLSLKTTIIAPKRWLFRDVSGADIADETKFKARFE